MNPLETAAFISDVPLEMEIVLDQRMMQISEVLELQAGSVIELRRSAGENIDIYIGRKLIGFGEIVVSENTMAVRITDFRTAP